MSAPARTDVAYLEDFGGKADGSVSGGTTDNGPPLVKALAQATAAGVPVVLRAASYCVASTTDVTNLAGARLLGSWGGRRGPFDVVQTASRLWWDGPAGGTLFSLRGMNYEMTGFQVACCQGTQLERAFDLEPPDPGQAVGVSTEHWFHHMSVLGYYGPVARGFVVSERPGAVNNEFHRWESVLLRGLTYAGVHVPGGAGQAKALQFEDVAFVGPGQYGFSCGTASADFHRCNFTGFGDGTVLQGFGAYEPIRVVGCRSEGCRRMIQWRGAKLKLADNSFSAGAITAPAKPPPGSEFIGGANSLVIDSDIYEYSERPGFCIGVIDGGKITLRNFDSYNPWPFPDNQSIGTYYWSENSQLGNHVWNGQISRQYDAAGVGAHKVYFPPAGLLGVADPATCPALSNVSGKLMLTNPGQPPREV